MINNLKYRRTAFGYTQSDLAYICGVSRNTICSLERNEYLPGGLLLKKLEYVLGSYSPSIFGLELEQVEELDLKMHDIYIKHHPDV